MNYQTPNSEFNATTVSSLVIANRLGPIRGTNTVTDREGIYEFLAVNETTDAIRIQIKDQSGNAVHDTRSGASDTADPATPVTPGNVLAH
jgi:hypothetical protein